MAGDWIKLRKDLFTDPAVMRLASLLKLDAPGAVGRLAAVWVWADTHADCHGVVTLVSRDCLDAVAGCPGFGHALAAVGWLEELPGDAGGIRFPRFDRHMGAGAKQRAQATNRKQAQRLRDVGTEKPHPQTAPYSSRSCHADVTPVSQNVVTREEKRREEKNKTPQPPADGGRVAAEPSTALAPIAPPKPKPDPAESVPLPDALDTPEFRAAWADWLTARRAKRKPVSAIAARDQLSSLAGIGSANAVACVRESIRNDWQGLFPDKFRAGAAPRVSLFDRGASQEARMAAQIAEALAGCDLPRPEGDR